MTLLIAPLLTGGLSVGSLQQAYGGDPSECSVDPSSVNEELNPGESITIPKTIECDFDIDPGMLGLTTACSGDLTELGIGISIISAPTSSALMLDEDISVGLNAQPGQSATCTLNFDLFEWGDSQSSSALQQITITVPTAEIDVKPGSDPNSVNVNTKGVLPVAILGGPGLDVEEIDISSVAGVTTSVDFAIDDLWVVAPLRCVVEDVNDDGTPDLNCKFSKAELMLDCWTSGIIVSGNLLDGTPFAGSDTIRPVPCQNDL